MEKQLTQGFSSIWRWIEGVIAFERQENLVERYDSEKYKYLQAELDKNLIRMRGLVNSSERAASDVEILLRQINGERAIRCNVNDSALRRNKVCNLAKNEHENFRRSAREHSSSDLSFKSTRKSRGKYE